MNLPKQKKRTLAFAQECSASFVHRFRPHLNAINQLSVFDIESTLRQGRLTQASSRGFTNNHDMPVFPLRYTVAIRPSVVSQ